MLSIPREQKLRHLAASQPSQELAGPPFRVRSYACDEAPDHWHGRLETLMIIAGAFLFLGGIRFLRHSG